MRIRVVSSRCQFRVCSFCSSTEIFFVASAQFLLLSHSKQCYCCQSFILPLQELGMVLTVELEGWLAALGSCTCSSFASACSASNTHYCIWYKLPVGLDYKFRLLTVAAYFAFYLWLLTRPAYALNIPLDSSTYVSMALTNSSDLETSVELLHGRKVLTELKKNKKLSENLRTNHIVVQEDWKLWQKPHWGKKKAFWSTKRDQRMETRATKE